MKSFHLTHYKVYRPEFAGLKVGLLSDVHFSTQVSDAKLQSIVDFFKKRQPDYLILPGDLFDSNESLDDPAEAERLLHWLKQLGRVAPLLYSLGNHEFLRATGQKHPHWYYEFNFDFFQRIIKLPNVHVLNDVSYEDKKLYAFGLTQDRDYYDFEFTHEGTGYLHPGQENKSALLKLFSAHKDKIHDLPKDKLKFAVIHSPVYLQDKDIRAKLKEFDFVISGHMHNGVVPPIFNELIPNQKGIIAPAKRFLPTTTRNTYKAYADQLIVLGPVTTFHKCSGVVHYLNALYPTYLAMLEFTKEQKYARKPYIGRKYLSK